MSTRRARVLGSVLVLLGGVAIGIGVVAFLTIRGSWPGLAFTSLVGAAIVALGVWAIREGADRAQ